LSTLHSFIEASSSVEKSPPEEPAPRSLDLDVAIEQLAVSQHGVVPLGQLREVEQALTRAERDGLVTLAERRERLKADRARNAELAAGGIQVLRVTWRQIRDQPEVIMVSLARALEASARQLAG